MVKKNPCTIEYFNNGNNLNIISLYESMYISASVFKTYLVPINYIYNYQFIFYINAF